jgi:hypothetical protein
MLGVFRFGCLWRRLFMRRFGILCMFFVMRRGNDAGRPFLR